MIARNNPVPIARTPIQSRSGASVCGVAAGGAGGGAGPPGAAPVGFRRPSEIRASPPRRNVSARVIDGALSFQKEPFAQTRSARDFGRRCCPYRLSSFLALQTNLRLAFRLVLLLCHGS